MNTCLYVALNRWKPARIVLPSIEQAQEWARTIENYEPRLRGCFGVADGYLIPLQHDSRYVNIVNLCCFVYHHC